MTDQQHHPTLTVPYQTDDSNLKLSIITFDDLLRDFNNNNYIIKLHNYDFNSQFEDVETTGYKNYCAYGSIANYVKFLSVDKRMDFYKKLFKDTSENNAANRLQIFDDKGDITDEYDIISASQKVNILNNNSLECDAKIDLSVLEATIGNFLTPKERKENNTLAGLIIFLLGRIPSKSEIIKHSSGVEFEIISSDSIKINKIIVHHKVTK